MKSIAGGACNFSRSTRPRTTASSRWPSRRSSSDSNFRSSKTLTAPAPRRWASSARPKSPCSIRRSGCAIAAGSTTSMRLGRPRRSAARRLAAGDRSRARRRDPPVDETAVDGCLITLRARPAARDGDVLRQRAPDSAEALPGVPPRRQPVGTVFTGEFRRRRRITAR